MSDAGHYHSTSMWNLYSRIRRTRFADDTSVQQRLKEMDRVFLFIDPIHKHGQHKCVPELQPSLVLFSSFD